MELMVSMAVLIPVMGAAVALLSTGANTHALGQNSIDANQDARAAMQIMTTEIAQAGTHQDVTTNADHIIHNINVNPTVGQTITVDSSAGFTVGDYVDVGQATDHEVVKLMAVGSGTLTGLFEQDHNYADVPIRLRALPFSDGVIPQDDIDIDDQRDVSTLKFFGHIQGDNSDTARNDPTIQYVEYGYDSGTSTITRSATPITQSTKAAALPFIRNVSNVRFTIHTDHLGVVTAVTVSFTVTNRPSSTSEFQHTSLSSRISIPSAIAGSNLQWEFEQYRGLYGLPPTPDIIETNWAVSQ
jgi:hypothetical protein